MAKDPPAHANRTDSCLQGQLWSKQGLQPLVSFQATRADALSLTTLSRKSLQKVKFVQRMCFPGKLGGGRSATYRVICVSVMLKVFKPASLTKGHPNFSTGKGGSSPPWTLIRAHVENLEYDAPCSTALPKELQMVVQGGYVAVSRCFTKTGFAKCHVHSKVHMVL